MDKAPTPTPASPSNPAEALAQTLRRIYDLGLTTTSGGNLSLRDDEGRLWITPAGIDKGELRADQIARVPAVDRGDTERANADASAAPRADFEPAPSSELPFHRAIYAKRPDIRAIVHAHPVSLVAFSIVHQVPDTRVSASCHALCSTVGFAAYALPGSRMLGEEIAGTFGKGFDCVVLENHGVVVGGRTLGEAFERLEALDLCARTITRARTIGRERILSPDELALAEESRLAAAPAAEAAFGDAELETRRKICAIAGRAFARHLFTTTEGALSARLTSETFLMTPSGVPLDRLQPKDLLRLGVRPEKRPGARSDSRNGIGAREALHAALYRAHPEIGAIAHGHGENTAGFSVSGVPLSARTIPESYLLVREPGSLPLRETLLDPTAATGILGPDSPVALLENDGALALGSDLLDAFDRLEVLEATAAALIASRPLGERTVMSDEQILELRRAFFPDGGLGGTSRPASSQTSVSPRPRSGGS